MIFNYIRVSTALQNTERQLLNIDYDREYLDRLSGKNTNRPQLQLMLSNLREGDYINVHSMDRLARNTKDLLSIVDKIIEKKATIKFHKENLIFNGFNQDNPLNKLMLTMLGAISTFERDLMLERQKEGIAIAKKKGKYKGRKSTFTPEDIEKIKLEFSTSKNKAELARKYKISRAYLYQLAKTKTQPNDPNNPTLDMWETL
jgi:DNA invertase Pin-like site-specific DNA recombinase